VLYKKAVGFDDAGEDDLGEFPARIGGGLGVMAMPSWVSAVRGRVRMVLRRRSAPRSGAGAGCGRVVVTVERQVPDQRAGPGLRELLGVRRGYVNRIALYVLALVHEVRRGLDHDEGGAGDRIVAPRLVRKTT
jgi:hypothetical protein